ncbi:MAG: ATP-binding cassette domain-containing protein [Chitinophagales bacterium]|nr:ATP-binding cassette domain-containing protein [Chitinophagales bacterium]
MLEVLNLTKSFNKNSPNEVLAIKDCSLKIPDEEFLVIIGSNGSGKSTLLNLIAGAYAPDRGKILIGTTDVTNQQNFKRSKYISRVFQDPMAGTAPDLSILDNFRLAALRTKRKTLRTGMQSQFRMKVQKRLKILGLGLENKLETLVGKLSGGQRQALTLLMSVMDDSAILLLDEPTAALDPGSSEKIIKIAEDVIKELKLTAVLVTHNMQYAVRLGSRLVLMKDGKIHKDFGTSEKEKLKVVDLFEWFT